MLSSLFCLTFPRVHMAKGFGLFPQGPIITTAPDLDRACASSLLPPLPSSSKNRHPRAMLTIPSSSGSARQQYSTAMMGRPHGIVNNLDALMRRADEAPMSRPPPMLSPLDGLTRSSHASHSPFRLSFREEPSAYNHETMLNKPDTVLRTSSSSMLSTHDSALTGTAPGLDKGYMGRQGASGMQSEVMDESQQAIDAACASLLMSGQSMNTSNSASMSSRVLGSGTSFSTSGPGLALIAYIICTVFCWVQ